MIKNIVIFITFFLTGLLSAKAATSGIPTADFTFIERTDGSQRSFLEMATALGDDCEIILILFDPDCGDCHRLLESVAAEITSADKNKGVFAIYPSDEDITPDDPNFRTYLKVAAELPAEFTVGYDNGSIINNDACDWETLPLLSRFSVKDLRESISRND